MDSTSPNAHTEALVRAFFAPERRERYLGLAQSRRGRVKLRQSLAHLHALDSRYASLLPPQVNDAAAIARLLRQLGAPQICYVLAESAALDDQLLPLEEALTSVVGRGSGAILSCRPGELAYYEGEDSGDRYVLQRTP